MQIKHLEFSRYSITEPNNDLNNLCHSEIQLGPKIVMAATYENLIAAHEKRLRSENPSQSIEQVIKNHRSALRRYLRSVDKTESSAIDVEFTSGFDKTVRVHLEISGISTNSKTDQRSLLNSWRATYELIKPVEDAISTAKKGKLVRRLEPAKHIPTYFEKGLLDALKSANLLPKTAARMAGVSTSAIQRWMNGALPNATTCKSLPKLDKVLNLPEGELSRLFEKTQGKLKSVYPNEFRERQKKSVKDFYLIKVKNLNSEFLAQWNGLFEHKTAIYSRKFPRHPGGQWALSDAKISAIAPTIINSKGSNVCASAQTHWSHISSFLGYLRYPIEKGGFGVTDAEAQSLAWLAIPEAVEGYLNFLTDRSDGLKHQGHKVFCQQVIGLTGTTYGYLKNCPELATSIPEKYLYKTSWANLCQETHKMCSEWKLQSNDKSRDPLLPIKPLLDLEKPLVPIFQVMDKLRRIADAAPAKSMGEATSRRDELLLGFLLSNPLRAKNIKTLTYKVDGSGNVYRSETGEWRLRFLSRRFKNGKKMGSTTYDVPIAGWLSELVCDYVRDFRPLLVKGTDPGYFFLSQNGLRFNSLNSQVFKLMRQHIPDCGGFGPHAFRHLVATDWLKKHPNDFFTVAELLNDSIEVVMANYVHLKKKMAFARYEEYINTIR